MNTKKNVPDSKIRHIIWWRRVDSNHRSESQQIYSLPNIFRFHCAAVAPQPIAQFYPCITQIFFRFFYFILGYHGVLWMSITRGGT